MSERVNPKKYGKVAVLMGGQSAEREVSLNSGNAVLTALLARGVDAHKIDVDDNVINELIDGSYDRAFIALHGPGGEDGTIQGALEILGIPYTGSGVMASALAMDKLRTKQIWIANGLPTPSFRVISSSTDLDAVLNDLGLPLIVKPSHEGSSIGISKVSDGKQLQAAWQLASKYDQEVIAESWVSGAEYTVAIVGVKALPLIRLETPHEIYDYDAKYKSNTTQYHCPCGLNEMLEKEFQQLALQAFRVVGACGWGRVDFMLDNNDKPWLIEVNTIPGLTDHSLVPMAAKVAGMDFDELMVSILEQSILSNES